MSKRPAVHVVPRGNDWAVKTEGTHRAHRVFERKADAVQIAHDQAKRNHVELVIHNRNGEIAQKNSFGSDSFPPRG